MTDEEKKEIEQPVETLPPSQPEEDFKDKYVRTLAEMENMRKRMQREKQEMTRFGIENAIAEFLPAIDNFENALRFAEQAVGDVKNWAIGFQMILAQFKEVLHNHGVVAFHSEGKAFNPETHEAVEIVETDEHADGTILQEFTKGYKSPARVIRPARVKVAKKPTKIDEPAEEAEQKITN
ncbi:MAG: nucleotide exchange factor GrpE [Verrucomicrobiota bacterium]|nr:nucleotide exchange factor GrpE [Verrucomicrobiota bacterium]